MNKILVASELVKLAKELIAFDSKDGVAVLQNALDRIGGGKVKMSGKGTLKTLDESYSAILYEIVNKDNKVIYAYLTKGTIARLFLSKKDNFKEPLSQMGINEKIDRQKLEGTMKEMFKSASTKQVDSEPLQGKKWNDAMYKKFVNQYHNTFVENSKDVPANERDGFIEDAASNVATEIQMNEKDVLTPFWPMGLNEYLKNKGVKDIHGALLDVLYSGIK